MIIEEQAQIGEAAVEEMSDIESEHPHREEEDHQKDKGDGRGEIGRELPLEDGQKRFHASASSWLVRLLNSPSIFPSGERRVRSAGVPSATNTPLLMITARLH